MAWTTPKIDWSSVPGVTHGDFNRIEENIAMLRTAVNILIIDSEGHFSSNNVEGALHELYTISR